MDNLKWYVYNLREAKEYQNRQNRIKVNTKASQELMGVSCILSLLKNKKNNLLNLNFEVSSKEFFYT